MNEPIDQQLPENKLEQLLQVADIGQLSRAGLEQLFRDDRNLFSQAPDGSWAEDPRSGELILFNPARARRPSSFVSDRIEAKTIRADDCPICAGKTTGAIDAAPLSEGFTFINKNLFAALFPHDHDRPRAVEDQPPARGMHFLQWTSTLHDRDWHNMPLADCVVVLERLAALESALLNGNHDDDTVAPPRAVVIIKNYGVAVGGSLAHGHQQIIAAESVPRRLHDDAEYERRTGQVFAQHMLERTPADLIVRDYESAVLVTPYFMKRPFDMLLLLRDHKKRYLHELTGREIASVASAWRDAMRAYLRLLPSIGRVPSFNILAHNGPGAGLYFEFMPFTQEYGGFERMGMFVCQSSPLSAANTLRTVFQALPVMD